MNILEISFNNKIELSLFKQQFLVETVFPVSNWNLSAINIEISE